MDSQTLLLESPELQEAVDLLAKLRQDSDCSPTDFETRLGISQRIYNLTGDFNEAEKAAWAETLKDHELACNKAMVLGWAGTALGGTLCGAVAARRGGGLLSILALGGLGAAYPKIGVPAALVVALLSKGN